MNNSVESPITTSSKVAVEKPKKKTWLIVLVIFLTVLFLSIVGFIVYTEFFQEPEVQENTQEIEVEETDLGVCEIGDEDCEEEEEIVVPIEDEYTQFEGEVISAKLPKGWSIVEYFDGEGTESLPDMGGSYSGLTAIDIINPDNLQVFTIQAVSGIGFAGCPNYALFEDDNEAYRLEQESMSFWVLPLEELMISISMI